MGNKKKIQLGEEGQALFELVIFLPLFIAMVTFFITIGNSINGSINQQKTLRGYYYYYIKDNSRGFIKRDLETTGTTRAGIHALGWQKEVFQGNVPVAPCYRFVSLFGDIGPAGETCENRSTENISQYIRVYTAYGVCSETFDSYDGVYRTRWQVPARGYAGFCTNSD